MKLTSARILNFKCFADSGEFVLQPGMNVIVGPNDAGKSAFLEALSLSSSSVPHRSAATAVTASSAVDAQSFVALKIRFDPNELTRLLMPFQQWSFPVNERESSSSARIRILEYFERGGEASYKFGLGGSLDLPSDSAGVSATSTHWALARNNSQPHAFTPEIDVQTIDWSSSFYARHVFDPIRQQIYRFNAERIKVGTCHSSVQPDSLATDASNLPAVLHRLSTHDRSRYDELIAAFRTVFPTVHWVSTLFSHSSLTIDINIWSIPLESKRPDLAVSLAQSGTGLGQVLAILVVAIMYDEPRTILIDEPQSFLHPGALRKLIEILRGYTQHQYVIATHAPTGIASTDAAVMLRAVRLGQSSTVEEISTSSRDALRIMMADVGMSPSDVFGADRILWVEGKTEEICFPFLVRAVNSSALLGVSFAGVSSTADLAVPKRDVIAKKVFAIYDQLMGATLLPPAAAFVFDSEQLTGIQRSDIERRSKQLIHWLPRRMFENYLLEPAALATVMNDLDAGADRPYTPSDVEQWIQTNCDTVECLDHGNSKPLVDSDGWRKNVDAAKLLTEMFAAMTEQRVSYDKVRDGLALTTAGLRQSSDSLRELGEFLVSLLLPSVTPGDSASTNV